MTRLPIAANDNAMQVCEPHRAKLSTRSCAGRWTVAQNDNSGQFDLCRRCEHGERNAAVAS